MPSSRPDYPQYRKDTTAGRAGQNAISLADEAKNKVEELKGRPDVGVTHGQARTGAIGRFAAPLSG
ncbi:MAG: hypothetical protein WCB57_16320 [Pseudonocardiaceae bacterium]